ncbi:MAG: fasciclin domain-containing protein [Pseudonocardiaceae bacterium]
MRKIQRLAAAGALAALTAVVGACSTSQGPATSGQPSSEAPQSSAQAAPNAAAPAPTGNGVTKISDIFGPACSQVPTEGPGSAQGMVNDPVATAASHNPLLTTLTKAVTAANLGDTLNSAPALTVFAPADPAFQALEAQHPGILKELTTAPDVASPNSQLAKILTYHVVGTRYDAAGLVQAGTLDSLEGGKLKIGGTAAAPTVNGAPVLCGNIPTKNATVFVIGQVLSLPAS